MVISQSTSTESYVIPDCTGIKGIGGKVWLALRRPDQYAVDEVDPGDEPHSFTDHLLSSHAVQVDQRHMAPSVQRAQRVSK